MINLKLNIGGRNFTISCEADDQEHVLGLAEFVNARVAALGSLAQQSESRMLLYTALMMADELGKAQKDLQSAQTTLEELKTQTSEAALTAPSPAISEEFGERLTSIAENLEKLVTTLEDNAQGD